MRARFADRKTDLPTHPKTGTASLEAQSTGSGAPTLGISAASPFARCWSVANRRKFEMNERQRREIAESAFKRPFNDVESFRVRPGFALKDDSPVVDVNTVYDGEHEQSSVRGFMRIRSELVDKAWREGKDDLG